MSPSLILKKIAVFTIVLHSVVSGIGQPNNILVGDWKMNEGGGVTLFDISGYGNNAVLQNPNEVTWGTGKNGLALFLPGTTNRFAIAPDNPSLNITDKITIAAWINPTELRNATILAKTGPDGYELAINNKGKVEFILNSNSNPNTYYLSSMAAYPYDGRTWMHVAGTFDGLVLRLYINGILNSTVTFNNPAAIKTNTSSLYIGSLGGSRRWKGGLDEVRLYQGALSSSEIASLAELNPPSVPGLVAPANSSNDISYSQVSLSWAASFGAQKYRAEVSQDPAFTSTFFVADEIIGTSIPVSGLSPNTLYYWRVRAINGGGNSNWSESWNFTTARPPEVPPVLTSVTISSNNANSNLAKPGDIVSLNFTASEPIRPPVVTIATHNVTSVSGSGNTFTATYVPTFADSTGEMAFTVDFSNTSGTPGIRVVTTTNGSKVNFDNARPRLEAINRQAPLTNTTLETTLVFRATFSESVNGVDQSDFLPFVANGSLVATVMSSTPVNSNVYDITVSVLSGTGTIRLDLKDEGTGIADEAGNLFDGGFSNGQTYNVELGMQVGFGSVQPLTAFNLTKETKDKPQAKTWKYAGKWWCVLSVPSGTKILRLDGNNWTGVLTLTDKNCRPDCIVVDNLVHILCYKDIGLFYTVEYDPVTITYKLWNKRPAKSTSSVNFPLGSQTATIAMDGNGRLWTASDSQNDIRIWWSDAPYTTWSSPITVANGIKDDDLCALVSMPEQNKIGLIWSDQTTKQFGFRTHIDGSNPSLWTADEKPASQSALNVGKGFADNHLNIKAAGDGTLYCAAKTGYDKSGYQHLILLIRRPSGIWDNAHTVTTFPDGTQPTLLLNEVRSSLKIVYTTATNGGSIVCRQTDLSNISFSAPFTLMNSPTTLYNFATSTHQSYEPDVVIMATDVSSTQMQAVSVLCTEPSITSPPQFLTTSNPAKSGSLLKENDFGLALQVFPNPFTTGVTLSFNLQKAGSYSLSLYDSRGKELAVLWKGWAEAGLKYKKYFDKSELAPGFYFVRLTTIGGTVSKKLVKM